MEGNVKKDWIFPKLKDLTSFVIGGDWGKDPLVVNDEEFVEVYCIRGSEFKSWKREKGETASLRKIKKSSLEKRELRKGDILLEISGGGPDQPVGRTVIIDDDALNRNDNYPKVCTNFFRLVRFEENLNKEYINHYLQYFYKSGEVVKYQGGSNNLRNLKFKEYETIKIPLPPPPEQDRIVAKLNKLFEQLEVINASLDKIPLLLKNFRQQVLTQAVTGKLSEEWRKGEELQGWEEKKMMELFEVKTGATPKRGNPKYYDNGKIAWLKSGQVKNQFIFTAEEFITEEAISETNAKIFPVDTLLVAMYGEGKTRGQVGWMKIAAASNQAVAALVNEEMDYVTRKYIYNFCLSQYNEIRAQAEGGNQPNLNLSKIKNWRVMLPPEMEQKEIVKRLESLSEKANSIEKQYKILKDKIENLPKSILHKAFNGELVP